MRILSCFNETHKLVLLAVFILLAACTRHSPGDNKAAPVYSREQDKKSQTYDPYSEEKVYPEQEQVTKTYPYQKQSEGEKNQFFTPEKPLAPAVVALLSQADKNYKLGKYGLAVGTIERALRIEPRNATLVYKLASVRLKQSKPRLAEDLAKKASLLAGNNTMIKRSSWLLIAEARRMQGNQFGAKEATLKAAGY